LRDTAIFPLVVAEKGDTGSFPEAEDGVERSSEGDEMRVVAAVVKPVLLCVEVVLHLEVYHISVKRNLLLIVGIGVEVIDPDPRSRKAV
jgi:hypothetical protein